MSFETNNETLTLTDLISRGYSRSTLPSNFGDPSRRGSTMSAYITDFDDRQDDDLDEDDTMSQTRHKFSCRFIKTCIITLLYTCKYLCSTCAVHLQYTCNCSCICILVGL